MLPTRSVQDIVMGVVLYINYFCNAHAQALRWYSFDYLSVLGREDDFYPGGQGLYPVGVLFAILAFNREIWIWFVS